MNILFEKIRFKNINSFGNAWTEFFFKNGVSIISAPNGSGKSSIINALCFCLYGKPYSNGIKIDELINNKNNKQLMTEVYFKVQDDSYCIQRGLKPSILKIIKNNEEMELLSHKSLIQEEIDKIVGVNHNLFKQIISLSLLNNKPFLSLDAKEKRDITESIFNIKVFGRMLKSLKKNNSVTKNSIDMNEKEIYLMKENLEGLVNQIKSLTKLKDEFEDGKEKDLKSLTDKCIVFNDDLRKIHRKLAKLNFKEKTFHEDDKKKLKLEYDELNNKKSMDTSILYNKQEELKFLEDESNDSSDYEHKYLELRELVSSFYEFIEQLKTDYIRKSKEEENKFRTESDKIKSEILSVENEIKEKNKESSFLTKDYIEKNLTEIIDKKKALTENKIKINNYKDDIELLKSKEGYCSYCKQEVSEEHKLKEIETRKNYIKSLSSINEQLIKEMENIISGHIKDKTELMTAYVESRNETIHDLKRSLLLNESKMRDNIILLDVGYEREINTLNERKLEIITSYINKTKENLKEDIDRLGKSIVKIHSEKNIIESKLNIIDKEQKIYNEEKLENSNLLIKEKNLKDNMMSIAESIQQLSDKQFTGDIETLKSDFETKKKNYQELKLKCEFQKRKLKIEEVIKEILDEQGIKKYFFSRLIPKLNQIINEYLNHFELPVYFKFDEEFEYEIKEVGNNLRSYQSFSGGERFRIDLSLILAMIELNKLINGFNCNIQVFDELLDSGVDSEGMENVLEKLKELTDKNNICTYIISHRPIENSEYVDNIIRLEKKSGFSRIVA